MGISAVARWEGTRVEGLFFFISHVKCICFDPQRFATSGKVTKSLQERRRLFGSVNKNFKNNFVEKETNRERKRENEEK